ncbi:uncharacterized protein FIBRA_02280 [Fibroporia radiculosa]|uniref:MMS19 nucleotide excision repair protein n=1 Tax=Fibroporia radiculosa TaxID=599839 RepID=J4I8Z1_9APHY|nr:uncharacterized protein FIBRA_02280 [Fibroporia radiculosa]CCM00251.1 predicted protein [Fibroporia radiculosa]
MESLDRPIRTWIASEREEEVIAVVSEISSGNATLLDVVKSLGKYLTAEEDELRTKGVDFLSLVLSKCPAEKMNRQSVRVLVAFYCGKLEDTETIVPALKGLVSLTAMPDLTSIDAVEVMKALINHVRMKVLIQSQRFTVYKIVDTLIANQRDALKGMGKEFLSGYISLAEGEKDPRNLLISFAIDRVLLLEFDVAAHVEDLFNITFCYFPITFRPPPDDPYGITTDDLKNALSACLHATPLFGPLAIPLFLEKLTAGTPITKRDTLKALDVSLPVYGASVARNHARKLWNSLKLEIFQPTDIITEEAALHTTQVLIRTIYSADDSESPSDKEEVHGLAKEACDECIEVLREPEKSQAKPAIKVLCAFMSTTPSVAKHTLSRTTPHLVKLFLDPDEMTNRGPILRLLADFIVASRDSMSKDSEVLPAEDDVPLLSYKDEVLGILTVGLKTPSSAQPALDGLKGMVTTRGLLTDEEIGFVVHNVNELLQKEGEESDEVSDYALNLLTVISDFASNHVSQTTLPLLFSSLPDRAPPRDAQPERLKYWRTLASLTRLCKQPDLFETLVVRLLTKLDLVCVPPTTAVNELESDTEPSAAYAHSLLRTISDVLAAKVDAGHSDVMKFIDRLVPRLYNLFIYSALMSDSTCMVATDPRLISVTAHIITLVVQTLTAQRQEAFVAVLFSGYLQGDVHQLADGYQKIPTDKKFEPLAPDAPGLHKNLLALLSAAVVALYKEVPLPCPDETTFLDTLLQWSCLCTDNVLQRDAIAHTISSVVNKRAGGLSSLLSEKADRFWTTQVADPSVPSEKRRHALCIWIWMTKALLVRGDAAATNYVNRLFELFDDAEISWDAARGVGSAIGTDKVLTKRNHAVIKVTSVLIMPYHIRADTDMFIDFLLPLLLRGLDLPDTEIRAAIMDTLFTAAQSGSKENNVVSEHASTLVSTMLKNCMVQETPSMRVRTAALRFLAILPNTVRYDVLHPYKATVIRELVKVLDDPKRAVRQEAVEARTNW